MDVISWLLEGDAAIRWQVLRDLQDAPEQEVAAARALVPISGLGAAILDAQGSDGSWHMVDEPDWIPTLFQALLLRSTGADPQHPRVAQAFARLEAGYRWHESLGGKCFSEGETEACINGGAMAAASCFGYPSVTLVERLLAEQLEDGGWNCEAPTSRRSSFHSTICVLEGLREYVAATAPSLALTQAMGRGEEYLLARGLFRRLSTGQIVDARFLQFAFPPRYRYDVLRALDHFRLTRAAGDPRMAEAIAALERRRESDGRWLLDASSPEVLVVPLGETVGQPSRWNTLRALRVLRWWYSLSPMA